MAKLQAIVMKAKDNVCTVIEDIAPEVVAGMEVGGEILRVQAVEAIPVGHKMAIRDIDLGENIIKYGEVIGRATQPIQKGKHVHVHNLESCRGRGDRPEFSA